MERIQPQPVAVKVVHCEDNGPITIINRVWAEAAARCCERCAVCSAEPIGAGLALCSIPVPDSIPFDEAADYEAPPDLYVDLETNRVPGKLSGIPYDKINNRPMDW